MRLHETKQKNILFALPEMFRRLAFVVVEFFPGQRFGVNVLVVRPVNTPSSPGFFVPAKRLPMGPMPRGVPMVRRTLQQHKKSQAKG